jgi:hypothetical protein
MRECAGISLPTSRHSPPGHPPSISEPATNRAAAIAHKRVAEAGREFGVDLEACGDVGGEAMSAGLEGARGTGATELDAEGSGWVGGESGHSALSAYARRSRL